MITLFTVLSANASFSRKGTGFSTSHLLRIIILCSSNELAFAMDPHVIDREQNMPAIASFFPSPNEHTFILLFTFIALALVIILACLCTGRRILIQPAGNRTSVGSAVPAAPNTVSSVHTVVIPLSPITYPPPPYPGSIRQHANTPAPILGMLGPLTVVPRDVRTHPIVPSLRARHCARPDLTIALLSLLLTFVGTVIGGIALLYTKHSVSRS